MNSKALNDYFTRIGYKGSVAPTLDNLRSIHQHHIETIPFENLNPLLGLPVKLDSDSLIQKLIYDRRGGYCFEQNLLFRDVLMTLGFAMKGLEARVISSETEVDTAHRTHMLLLVDLNGINYTVDVGFGGMNPAIPLVFQPGMEQPSSFETYRFLEKDSNYFLQVKIKADWKYMYSFDLQEQYPIDYEVANWYVSTSPDSIFTKNLVVSRRAKESRFTLSNNIFATYDFRGAVKKEQLQNVAELKNVLTDVFGINISGLNGLDAKLERLLIIEQEI